MTPRKRRDSSGYKEGAQTHARSQSSVPTLVKRSKPHSFLFGCEEKVKFWGAIVGKKAQCRMMGQRPNPDKGLCPKRIKTSMYCHPGKSTANEGQMVRPKTTFSVRRDHPQRACPELDQGAVLKIFLRKLSPKHAKLRSYHEISYQ